MDALIRLDEVTKHGDHPEAATERMRWVRRLAADIRSARWP